MSSSKENIDMMEPSDYVGIGKIPAEVQVTINDTGWSEHDKATMIVKKFKRNVINKPKATIISGLVDYILAATDELGREKCVYTNSRNFITSSTAAQKLEMISIAEESVHSKMPVTHWILSWSDNETPSTAQVDEAVTMFLKGMELGEHQAIYGVHGNTDNYHVHILVNK